MAWDSVVVQASNALTMRWARQHCDGAGTAIAGAAVWPLLSVLAAGAQSEARRELEAATGIPASDGMAAATSALHLLNSSPAIRSARGAWVHAGLPVEDEWLAAAPVGVVGRFHGDGHDQERLDAWVTQHTDGRIPRMPVTIDHETLVVLADALTVCTGWQQPFDTSPAQTGFPDWVGSRDGLANIAYLSRVGTEADELQIAERTSVGPLTLCEVRGNEDISVYLALAGQKAPPGGVVAEAIRATADSRQGRRGSTLAEDYAAPGLSIRATRSTRPMPTTIRVVTVPFRIEVEHDLLRIADIFGLQSATDRSRGHFSRISHVPLAVSQAKQTAMAAFSAQGFEAAAVTDVGFELGASMFEASLAYQYLEIVVRFNRPFAFVAVHRPSRLVLVAGWVASPQPVSNPWS